MKTNRNLKLKSIIQQSGSDQPMPDFTAMVMKDIHADHAEEFQISDKLKSFLQQYGTEKLPENFTQLVMAELMELQKENTIKPIISFKTGLIVAILSGICVCLAAVFNQGGAANNRPYTGLNVLNNLLNQLSSHGNTAVFYSLALILISILLFSDYFLRYHRLKLR